MADHGGRSQALQQRLRPLVRFDGAPQEVRYAAGLDVDYREDSDELVAAVTVPQWAMFLDAVKSDRFNR
ncbi:hypothetical protein QFW96_19580 [Saccharopolyspora sp. TS4A08]|uniref:DUF397 domain-containing protein n=1 Tax=Saccharopolyspora ipomoeae TaxID=3042027 RepID=A0ABT6PS51_9PSEU|nr:hypothetical protein [Saccharopolyspora sp. TS4A08]MDI2030843.1 hypothetical protein [Saccharopolyspora sp. TS4A08]